MRKLILMLVAGFLLSGLQAQQPGDTIVVKAFKYGSTSRDSLIAFPSGSLTFEKIIMKYNMRCKNGLVSTQTAPDQGCGEWDYSCNTFIVDSSRIEEVPSTHPEYIITGNTGNVFRYKNTPIYDYYRFRQIPVTLQSVTTENPYQIGSGTASVSLNTDLHSGKYQILIRASELMAAGFSAGAIQGLMLDVVNGGSAQFFKMGIRHTSLNALSPDSLELTGLTEVYNQHVTFVTGSNRLQFHTPFMWDGVSNVMLQITFTNSVTGNPVVLAGTSTPYTSVLSASNNYSLYLGSSALVTLNTAMMGTISNQVTVSFWSYGNPDLLPANTTILYGYANTPGQRHLNMHLPWANGSVYFDCGFSGSFDRIYKAATPSEYEGQWNHWAFTKNTTTGVMNIYLNGSLWQTGTGLTKTMSILNLLLGNNNSQDANLAIWDKALSASEIKGWMRRLPDTGHPSWGNLVAYYKVGEGSGDTLTDLKHNLTSGGVNMQWGFDRGEKLGTLFTESTIRPNVKLLRGTYVIDTLHVWAFDSVQRNPNTVKKYTITPALPGSAQHDVVTLVSTSQLYAASPVKYNDGDADTLLYTVNVLPDDSIVIASLPYFRRFPWYNEIMSFVTPYGKGLDLGMDGKTWYFDVTDFSPLLKGNKRMMMTGGVYQEDLDIDFWFIVGTPPRNVLEFNQLYQGYARAGQASIAAINNNTRFAPQNIPLLTAGEFFKVRAVITGHGNEGEFQQNGGVVYHYLRVNDTLNTHNWSLHKECSFNPVFPQGGTWVYDRQGWCPGEYSLLKEFDISSLVNGGDTATIDYHCSPPTMSGAYNYLAAIQLVTYGAPNHTLDAAITEINAPSTKVEYSRRNPICASPELVVNNTGSTTIHSLEISYWLNNAAIKQNYIVTDTILPFQQKIITLPTGALWDHDLKPTDNVFRAQILKVNLATDNYLLNNTFASPFEVSERIPRKFIVEVRTNNYYSENSYKIYDEAGNVVPGTSTFTASNTYYRDTLTLDGCYKLKVTDSGNDGMQWWANTAQGSGFVRLKKTNGQLIRTFEADFGGGFEYQFSTVDDSGIGESSEDLDIRLYPNPASGYFILEGNDIRPEYFGLEDMTGKVFKVPVEASGSTLKIETSALAPGLYRAILSTPESTRVFKVLVL